MTGLFTPNGECVELIQNDACSSPGGTGEPCLTLLGFPGACDDNSNCVPRCDLGDPCIAASGEPGSCDPANYCVEGLPASSDFCAIEAGSGPGIAGPDVDPMGEQVAALGDDPERALAWLGPNPSPDPLDDNDPPPSPNCDPTTTFNCVYQDQSALSDNSPPSNPYGAGGSWGFTPGPNADITTVLDQAFVNALHNYQCPAPTSTFWHYEYYEGIQAYDPNRDNWLKNRLGGDIATANLYNKYALQGANNTRSRIRNWNLFAYYNTPTNTSAAGSANGTGYNVTVLGNAEPVRWPVRAPGGTIVSFGDQLTVRLMGLLAAAPTDGAFKQGQPTFVGNAQGAQDRRDWNAYVVSRVASLQWARFIYAAAWAQAISMKCGYPVFAHSGGGAIINFVGRLLAIHPGVAAELRNAKVNAFILVGFEDVVSTEVRNLLQGAGAYGNKLSVLNYIAPPNGSTTWDDTIVRGIRTAGLHEYSTRAADTSVRWSSLWGGSHAGVGMYPLIHGRLGNAFWINHYTGH